MSSAVEIQSNTTSPSSPVVHYRASVIHPVLQDEIMKESGLAMTERQLLIQVGQYQRNPATRNPTLYLIQ